MSDPVVGADALPTSALAKVESMPWPTRNRVSLAVSLVLTPIGLASAMSGGYLLYTEAVSLGTSPAGVGLVLLGSLLLLVVSAAGRIAGIGPVSAGVVCCLFGLLVTFSDQLLWELTNLVGIRALQIGMFSYGSVLLPVVGALLVGTGFAGRWKRDPADGQSAPRGPIVEL